VRIVLSGKLGLPKLVTPGASTKEVASSLAKMSIKEEVEDEEGSVDKSDGDSQGSDNAKQAEEEGTDPTRRRKGETAEEKRARKRLVKEERRQNRTFKKQLKGAFASEQRLQTNVKTQDTDYISVFRY
jgi:FtsZ-interacting cell division protein YlmF